MSDEVAPVTEDIPKMSQESTQMTELAPKEPTPSEDTTPVETPAPKEPTPSEDTTPVTAAPPKKSFYPPTPPPKNQGFYSFFNKVDSFLTAKLPEDTSYLNKAVKKNLFVLNQKLNDLTQGDAPGAFQKSTLPQSYLELENKCDSIERILKKILAITETYAIEGYDYPPNLSEGISDFLSFNKPAAPKATGAQTGNAKPLKKSSKFLPSSFAQALSSTFSESHTQLSSVTAADEEEDECIGDMIKIFQTLAQSQQEIDEVKQEMDTKMCDDFNKGLKNLLATDLHKIHQARKLVESSRLDLDALRYGLVGKQVSKDDPELAEKDKLEDCFVTNTSDAVSIMGEFIDSVELLKLLKLFNTLQLDFHQKCVIALQNSMKVLDSIDLDDQE